jgi:hypothetical protein
MKKFLLAIAVVLSSFNFAMGHESIQNSEFLTDIVKIEQDHAFPVETVKLTYVRHCEEEFSNVYMAAVAPGYSELGVTVKTGTAVCTMDKPVWIYEQVTIQLNSETPTTYGLLKSLEAAVPFDSMSGVSVDTFN